MFIKLYLISLSVFALLDMFWLGLVAKNFYREHLGFLMKTKVNLPAAIVFYLLFIAGLLVFAVFPAVEKKIWTNALVIGAFFGLVTYATYDLTNLATLKDWPLVVTIVDLIWGAVVSAVVAIISYFIAIKLGF